MDSGQRPRHRRRGREGHPSPAHSERILVLPGEEIRADGLRPGPGTYRISGKVYASVLGLLQRKPPLVRVAPLSGRYAPHPGDVIIGIVTDVQGSFWLLDIAAARWAPLHMTGTPWKIDFGETGEHLHVGDAVVVAVEQIENSGRIGVTMIGEGLGRLDGGTLVTLSPAKIPRVIGKGGSMIDTLTRATGCKIVVGQNGRIWVDGPLEGVDRVRASLELIEVEGQRRGLTERVAKLLADTEPAGPEGRGAAPRGETPESTPEPPAPFDSESESLEEP
ncbi:MAG TPA: exosome complex protein Rrp4 [Thermoplasmata archaeon]|nr:exosome complex protein Rrp4 [Thermoplasmata archaeon]